MKINRFQFGFLVGLTHTAFAVFFLWVLHFTQPFVNFYDTSYNMQAILLIFLIFYTYGRSIKYDKYRERMLDKMINHEK